MDYTGCDSSDSMIALAAEANPDAKVIKASLPEETSIFKDGEFELVFCSRLLHHLGSPRQSIQELKRIASFLVVVHFRSVIGSEAVRFEGSHYGIVYLPELQYTRNMLEDLGAIEEHIVSSGYVTTPSGEKVMTVEPYYVIGVG